MHRSASRWSVFGRVDPNLCYLALVTNLLVFASAAVERSLTPSVGAGETATVFERDPQLDRLPPLTLAGRDAYLRLQAESVFVSARIGYAGVSSEQAHALRTLLAEPNHRIFRILMDRGAHPAARLYGLLGLRLTDPVRYGNAHIELAYDQTRLQTQYGCIVAERTVADITREIDEGSMPREFLSDRSRGQTP